MRCASCRHDNRAGAKFCDECGSRLTSMGAAPAGGERRQLTVMFCDLVGSTELAGRMDAEDFRELVAAYQDAAGRVVERYDGHIAQYLGDGLLVYFGYPRAHEDDPERGVRAGLEIAGATRRLSERFASQLDTPVAVRIGVHTGPVVVGEMGAGERRETQALGATMNIAARLEGIAEPNSVVVSLATRQLVPGLFVTTSLGTPALKGVDPPIEVHRVERPSGVRGRIEVARDQLTRLVGREEELDRLQRAFERAAAGAGRVILVRGEAGIGKSRLLRAFRDRLETLPHSWLETHTTQYAMGTPFFPLIELIERGVGLKHDDEDEEKLRRLDAALAAAGLPSESAVPLLAPLVGIPLGDRYDPLPASPAMLRQLRIDTVVDWLIALAAHQPLVLQVEDLHWSDSSTVDVLHRLVERIGSSSILLLLSARPEFAEPWEAGDTGSTIELEGLGRGAAAELVRSMHGAGDLPDHAVDEILRRSDGVPLYLEEIAKSVAESEGGDVPSSLRDSLMSRLDRLPRGKAVAQIGAVLGRTFPHPLLAGVGALDPGALESGVAELVDAGLLYRDERGAAASYSFKHALVEETAYESVLRSRRRTLHERAAQILNDRYPEIVEAEPERMAVHCERAGLIEEAITHLLRAGAVANERSAYTDASAHLAHGLELADQLAAGAERARFVLELSLGLGVPLTATRGYTHPDSVATYERAAEALEQLGDTPERPRVLLGLLRPRMTSGDFRPSTSALGEEALSIAQSRGDPFVELWARQCLGSVYMFAGDPARGLSHLERSIALYDAERDHPHIAAVGYDNFAVAHAYRASCLTGLGRFDRGLEALDIALDAAETLRHPFSILLARMVDAVLHNWRRDTTETLRAAETLIRVSDEFGFPPFKGFGFAMNAWARAIDGKPQGASDVVAGVVQGYDQAGFRITNPQLQLALVECLRLEGRGSEALDCARKAIDELRVREQCLNTCELRRLEGEILIDLDPDAGDTAEASLRAALEESRARGIPLYELRAATSLARHWHAAGRDAAARSLLAPVLERFHEGRSLADLREADELQGQLV